MDTNADVYVGQRIREWRLRRGLSQQMLADRVGISRTLVTMHENGDRELDSRQRLYQFAQALNVSVGDLTGVNEDRLNPNVVDFHAAVPRIEAALMCVGNMDLPGPLRPVAELAAEADQALRIRAATDYSTLGKLLPDLITGLFQHTQSNRDRDLAWAGLAKVAFATSLATKGLGHTSLSWTAANTAVLAARQTERPVDLAAAAYVRAQVMLATPGAVAASLKYTTGVIDELTGDAQTSPDRELLGMLHLHAGLTTAAMGEDPVDHLRAVDGLMQQTGEGTNAYEMSFGPANTAVWRMSMALEQRQGDRAIREAERLDPNSIDSPDRQSRYFIELARGQFMEHDPLGAQSSILRAETIAPQQVRTRTTVRELVGQMLRQARRESPLAQLAQRVGAVPA